MNDVDHPFECRVPVISDGVSSQYTLRRWLIPDGGHVVVDGLICELETEKATAEVPCETLGV